MNPASPAIAPARAMQAALRLEVLTIGWMVIEASASIGAGAVAGSVLLLAFGVDSVIELISAGVLYHRLRREADGTANAAEIEALEHRAARIAGYLLWLPMSCCNPAMGYCIGIRQKPLLSASLSRS